MNGLETIGSRFAFADTVGRLVDRIEAEGWHLFARIDHAEQARKKGLALRPTVLLLVGNAAIGTKLMQDSQLAGIDLPMKILVWEDADGRVSVTSNASEWIRQRHKLTDEATIEAIRTVVNHLRASVAAGD